jgi:hypothetical protein
MVPVLLPPEDQRIATVADVQSAKNDIRREMKLWGALLGLGGQALAALIAGVLTARPQAPAQVAQALVQLF